MGQKDGEVQALLFLRGCWVIFFFWRTSVGKLDMQDEIWIFITAKKNTGLLGIRKFGYYAR